MNRRLLPFALAFVLTPVVTRAGTPVTIGERFDFPSRVLGEERRLYVSLPASYARSKQGYPVLYMTDGEAHFLDSVATAAFLARNGLMPGVIVVAVGNTDRLRTPNAFAPGWRRRFRRGESRGVVVNLGPLRYRIAAHSDQPGATLRRAFSRWCGDPRKPRRRRRSVKPAGPAPTIISPTRSAENDVWNGDRPR